MPPILAIVILYCILPSACCLRLLPMHPHVRSSRLVSSLLESKKYYHLLVSSLLESKKYYHLLVHCYFVRTGTSTQIASQFLPSKISTTSFSLASSCSDVQHVPPRAVSSLRACFDSTYANTVFPLGTSAAIASQFLPLCFSTASISVLSSYLVQ
jgi:hypothetical protein